MKIGPLDNNAITSNVQGDRKASGSAPKAANNGAASPAAATPSAEASAQVAISSAGSALSAGGNDASFDAAKVERISQAIRDGKFEVNPEKIADKLLSNARELLSGKTVN